MILFDNWRIKYVGEPLARQYDNLSRILLVNGVPDGYDWTMMVQVKEYFDVIALAPMEDGVGVVLTAEQLSLAGYYSMQLVGTLKDDGVTKRHTNILQVYVDNSLSGDANWPTVPSEFSQMEANILELSKHPPIPGESGFWKIWDLDSHSYVESEFPLREVSGTGGSVELDTTLKEAGKAADAKAVGDALSTLTEEIENIPGGQDGVTPTIGDNGNWYLGDTDTGKPSRGEAGSQGPAGADGYTPQKGTDYWTTADQQAIVDDVLAALPTWEGGRY